ncbi:ROK family protein [Butyricicoccus pullicaecorum]|nr:ROK family protein [Butyricicoccus pullicaecorum]
MYRIGIDLGGTNTVAGLCTAEGKLLDKVSAPTKTGDPEGLCGCMKELCLSLCEKHSVPHDEIMRIGIGLPGTFVKETRTLTFGTNLGLRDVCFAHVFEPEFACRVEIDNDANCAALGEFAGGAGAGTRNLIMVTLGTGVGGGLIVGGQLYTGRANIAGEIGHMVIVPDGLPCNCGRKGCLETYASATGLINLALRALEDSTVDSLLRGRMAENGGRLTAKMVCDARDDGDALADRVFDSYCDYLACGLTNLVNIFQPDAVVLGGGVAGYGEKLLAPLRERVHRDQFKIGDDGTPIVRATLGNDAGIIGAALL